LPAAAEGISRMKGFAMGAVITGAPGVPGAVAIEKSAGPTGSARRVNRGRLDPVDGTLLSRRFRIGAGLYMRPQLQAAGYVSIAQAQSIRNPVGSTMEFK